MWQQESVEATYVATMPTQLMFFPHWKKSCLLTLCCWFKLAGGSAPLSCLLTFPISQYDGGENQKIKVELVG